MKQICCALIFLLLIADNTIKAIGFGCRPKEHDKCQTYDYLVCSGSCSDGTSVQLKDGRTLTCRGKVTLVPLRSHSTDKNAPQPESFNVGCHYIPGTYINKKVAIDLTWVYKEHEIRENHTNGFYIYVGIVKIFVSLEIKGNKTEKHIDVPPCIKFHYSCYGSDTHVKKAYTNLEIYPLPPSESNSLCWELKRKDFDRCDPITPSPATAHMTSPNTNRTPTSTKGITLGVRRKEENNWTSQTAILLIFLAVLIVAAIVLSLVYFICCRTSRQKKPENGEDLSPTNSLMLASEDDHSNAHSMMLKRRTGIENTPGCNMKITANWEHSKEIGVDGFTWYQKEFEKAPIVVFINLAHVMDDTKIQKRSILPVEASVREYFKSGIYHGKTTILLEDNTEEVLPYLKNLCKVFKFKTEYTRKDDFYRFWKKLVLQKRHQPQNKTERSNRNDVVVPTRNLDDDENTIWQPMQDNCHVGTETSIESSHMEEENSDDATTERDRFLAQGARPKIRAETAL